MTGERRVKGVGLEDQPLRGEEEPPADRPLGVLRVVRRPRIDEVLAGGQGSARCLHGVHATTALPIERFVCCGELVGLCRPDTCDVSRRRS